jgi:hypothetical protein
LALLPCSWSRDRLTTSATISCRQVDLYLIETCERGGCTHQAIIEMPGLQGEPIQIRCGLDIEATEPTFGSLDVNWTSDERGVLISFAGADGTEQSIAMDLDRDCNL